MTDIPDAVPQMQQTVEWNQAAVIERGGSLTAMDYYWGSDSGSLREAVKGLSAYGATEYDIIDIVIAADVVYNEDLFEPLCAAFVDLVGPTTFCLLSFIKRWKKTNRFFKMLKKHFKLEIVESSVMEKYDGVRGDQHEDDEDMVGGAQSRSVQQCIVYRLVPLRK
eukprot:comp12245_c0_seq2/m.7037 comp12245_c0_seq2/g.7037  ORF comp12245_c0_seq2/g.7037 comp12245_c0_seq2/m.7037 type:complete len:165 (-) comp12245_c0_seq2:376-870(-)